MNRMNGLHIDIWEDEFGCSVRAGYKDELTSEDVVLCCLGQDEIRQLKLSDILDALMMM